MVKAYLKYQFHSMTGVISSNNSNCKYNPHIKCIMSAANEQLLLINIKTGNCLITFIEFKGEIIQIFKTPDKSVAITYIQYPQLNITPYLAAGHMDGEIILYNRQTDFPSISLNQHKAAITIIQFNFDDSILFSGSQDTSIIVFDIISQTALFKFSGHKNAITHLEYIEVQDEENLLNNKILISSAKDGLVKFWDLNISTCVATYSNLTNEILHFYYFKESNIILIGTSTDELVLLRVKMFYDPNEKMKKYYEFLGIIKRQSFARLEQIEFDPINSLLFILTGTKTIEVYKYLSEQEIMKKAKRKKKRMISNQKQEEFDETAFKANIQNYLQNKQTIHLDKKMRSFSFFHSKSSHFYFVGNFHNNNVNNKFYILFQLIIYEYSVLEQLNTVNLTPGLTYEKKCPHQSIQHLAISSDDSLLLALSAAGFHLYYQEQNNLYFLTSSNEWENKSNSKMTSGVFLENKYIVLTTENGEIIIYNIPSREVVFQCTGHNSEKIVNCAIVQDILQPKLLLMTAGNDNQISFWSFHLIAKQLTLKEEKKLSLQLSDCPTKAIQYKNFLLVALIDNSIIIYLLPTFKLFLKLYGHSLLINSIDISTDQELIISGGADKNVKIWGAQFGDCQRSIFAHDKAITKVGFVRDTHYFFSAAKDVIIKFWDADTFQQIMEFNDNLAEVNTFVISQIGDFFISGGGDKSIRFWLQTKEQVFYVEEEEKRQEKIMVENYTKEQLRQEEIYNQDKIQENAVEVEKSSYENLKYGDDLMNALDNVEKLKAEQIEFEQDCLKKRDSQGNEEISMKTYPNLGNISIPEYVIYHLKKIKLCHLENSLKYLHLPYIEKLLDYLNYFIQNNIEIELCSRVLQFIIDTHKIFLENSKKYTSLLLQMRSNMRSYLTKEADVLGFNLIGLKFLQKEIKNREEEKINEKFLLSSL